MAKYELLSQLPATSARKYLAVQRGFSAFRKLVVLREILDELKTDEAAFTAFLHEAKIAALFSHPNVADLFDLDAEGAHLYVASEFVPGATLAELVRTCHRANLKLPLEASLAVLRDACRGVAYAHGYLDPSGRHTGVLHRGLSDETLLISFDGVTKVTDFGLPASAEGEAAAFTAPEYGWGDTVDARADVYALGVLLQQAVAEARAGGGKIPQGLDAVAGRATARAREQRFGAVQELARAIEGAAGRGWEPGQLATFMQRLFADRRTKMAELVKLVEVKETTAVMKLSDIFEGGATADAHAAVAEVTQPRAKTPRHLGDEAPTLGTTLPGAPVARRASFARSLGRAVLFFVLLVAAFAGGAYLMDPPRARFIGLSLIGRAPPAAVPAQAPAGAPEDPLAAGASGAAEATPTPAPAEDAGTSIAATAELPADAGTVAAATKKAPAERTTRTTRKRRRP